MLKNLFKNIGFLTISQVANYVLPLITIPYITRVVGPGNYGLIEFATTAMLYFSAIVIYGFQVSATRRIAENPQDMEHVSRVFSAVLVARLSLFLLSTVIFLICMFLVPEFREESTLMWAAFPLVLGWAIYPQFLFQGLQKLQYVAVSNFAVKALAAIFIFTLLYTPEDYYLVLAINSGAQILVALALLFFSFRIVPGLHFTGAGISVVKEYLSTGSYIFLSTFFMRIAQFSSVLFIGFYLSDTEMGLFAAGAKLIIVAYSFLFLPLSGALFPYLTNALKEDPAQYLARFKRGFLLMIGVTLISTLVLVLVPELFVKLVFGSEYLDAVPYLQIMAPILLFATISHFSLQQGLIIFNKDKTYLAIVIAVGVISIVLNIGFIEAFGLAGAAYAKLGGEVALALLGGFFFFKYWRKRSWAGV